MGLEPDVSTLRRRAIRGWPVVALLNVDVRNDDRRLEYHPIEVVAGFLRFHLLDEVRHVVRESEEMLFVGVGAGLTGDRELAGRVAVPERAAPLNLEHIVSRDAVVEDYAPAHLELVSGLGEIVGGNVSV